jgi:HAD superfamily hydrolase (TIGR01509 family)
MDAVIFDLDGVIVNSEIHWRQIEGASLKKIVPTWNDEDSKKIIGRSLHDIYIMITDEYKVKITRQKFFDLYDEMAKEIYLKRVTLIDGFMELIQNLSKNDVYIGLASSSRLNWIDMVVDRFNIRKLFDVIVSADELNGEGKPSPAIYIHASKKLSVTPEKCVAIEDSKNGVLSAKGAQMFCVGFRNGFNEEQDLSKADIIIHNLNEIEYEKLLKFIDF